MKGERRKVKQAPVPSAGATGQVLVPHARATGQAGQVGPSLRGEGFSVLGRLAGVGGKAAHGVEGIFFDAPQPAGLFGMSAVKIYTVSDQLGHGDAFS